ncbi:MAG: helix-turn-helix domain containing protein [Rhizobiaceae bacterium]
MTNPIPAHLKPYVDILGKTLAAEFFLAFGGAEIYLAKKPTEVSMVAQMIGVEKVGKLAKELGGMHAKVPLAKRWSAEHYLSQGWSIAKIARSVRADMATVRRWLGPGPSSRQMDMFEKSNNL